MIIIKFMFETDKSKFFHALHISSFSVLFCHRWWLSFYIYISKMRKITPQTSSLPHGVVQLTPILILLKRAALSCFLYIHKTKYVILALTLPQFDLHSNSWVLYSLIHSLCILSILNSAGDEEKKVIIIMCTPKKKVKYF